ncbi:hypothetical protein [Croceivirga sp. JEA036]|uniref:hypothetical protein n=1 Tax=Croceivirga sp. JEA036 TaxID=2721162 RepID=UPI00143C61BB|nr:hypothetical protein [Croceivirga sp. JEA036]NJB35017.1 hypothetical protein [Croceivirga sp. JEA036]
MRTLLFKILLLLLVAAPPSAKAAPNDTHWSGKHTKEKTIKKEFTVNMDALLRVKNSYGNLNISSWDQNKVLIEVHIKTNGNDEERVKERLAEIDVDFENTASMVSAITRFTEKKSSWGWNWGGKHNVNVQVNYTIKVPVKNSVNLGNDYGSIFLDRIDGHAKISCDYGKMEIGELRGRNNELRFDYTSKSTFEYVNSAEIFADYSGFTIEKAGNLIIRADYTHSNIEKMEHLDYVSDYGSIDVGYAKNVQGRGSYISVKLGDVEGNVDINADYGSVKINRMMPNAGNIDINSDYTGIKIGYDSDYQFTFEINTEYAGVSGKEDFEINYSNEKSTRKYYKGFHGNANAPNTVTINSEYGGISFFNN